MSRDEEERRAAPPHSVGRAAEEALAWYVRLKDPVANEEDWSAFGVWLDSSAEHRRAYAEAANLWRRLTEPAARLGAGGWYRQPVRGAIRRWRLVPAFALAASVLLFVTALLWRDPGLVDRAFADYATVPGERREVALVDGSRLLLDGDSAVSVRISARERTVKLRRGRIWLDVAHDPALGFSVQAAGVEARVLGTAFDVDRQAGTVTVTVERGRVAVAPHDLSGGGVVLSAGQRVRMLPGARPVPQAVAGETAFAWRRGLIVFDRASLGEVVASLDRMSKGRVLIADGTLQRLTLSGVFRADDPDAVLDALRSALGVRTIILPGMATLIYR